MPLPPDLKARIQRYTAVGAPTLNETDTQRVIIEPVLAWLGFDIYDVDEVREQVSIQAAGRGPGEGKVDYIVAARGRAHLMIDAKRLGASLSDPLKVQQVLTYCNAHPHRPRWGVLTDGVRWEIHDHEAAEVGTLDRRIHQIDLLLRADDILVLSPRGAPLLKKFADDLNDARRNPALRTRLERIARIELDEGVGALIATLPRGGEQRDGELAPPLPPPPPPPPANSGNEACHSYDLA